METITKKTVSIQFEGKRYTIPDDITVAMFLTQIGLPENTPVRITTTKEGFLLEPQIQKN